MQSYQYMHIQKCSYFAAHELTVKTAKIGPLKKRPAIHYMTKHRAQSQYISKSCILYSFPLKYQHINASKLPLCELTSSWL